MLHVFPWLSSWNNLPVNMKLNFETRNCHDSEPWTLKRHWINILDFLLMGILDHGPSLVFPCVLDMFWVVPFWGLFPVLFWNNAPCVSLAWFPAFVLFSCPVMVYTCSQWGFTCVHPASCVYKSLCFCPSGSLFISTVFSISCFLVFLSVYLIVWA